MGNRLKARKVETAKPGKYSDGGNLYLVVSATCTRKWVFRFTWRGRAKEMGLGSASTVPLAEARERAASARQAMARGLNPIDERKRASGVPTFGEMADAVYQSLSAGFRSGPHRGQWKSTLATYAAPLKAMPVNTVITADVLAVLKPIWQAKPETASRLRGRIEKILDAAKAEGFREGENPARGRGHLYHLLPRPSKLTRGHFAAMPYEQVAAFVGRLREDNSLGALALELCILTAARSGEILGMRWDEVDLEQAVWTLPKHRMKAGREHRVPLSARAVAILRQLMELKADDFVFPGQRKGRPSDKTMARTLERMKAGHITVHGFRSSFRDWAGNETSFPREVVETALAHLVGSEVERSYRRSDALEKRRQLMEAWTAYCEPGQRDNVVRLGSKASGT
jgi:integrase